MPIDEDEERIQREETAKFQEKFGAAIASPIPTLIVIGVFVLLCVVCWMHVK